VVYISFPNKVSSAEIAREFLGNPSSVRCDACSQFSIMPNPGGATAAPKSNLVVLRIQPLMSQMNKPRRLLRVAMTRRTHLLETIPCWKAIILPASAIFQIQRNMLFPYQLENLTSLVNEYLVLLERKYRALTRSFRTLGAFVLHVTC